MAPSEFEQILWEDWISAYWIPTITMQEDILFVLVHKSVQPSLLKSKKANEEAEAEITTEYTEGEDGYTYAQRRDPITGEMYLEPIYTLKKEV